LREGLWNTKQNVCNQRFVNEATAVSSINAIASFNEHQRMSCDGLRAAAVVRARAKQDARVHAAKVQASTLVLHCEGDLVVPLALGHELAASIPGARFELLHSRNHLLLPQEPAFERLCQVITEFVAHKLRHDPAVAGLRSARCWRDWQPPRATTCI
jgi:pimeloyl-ACP methyl ester carboxylesterase